MGGEREREDALEDAETQTVGAKGPGRSPGERRWAWCQVKEGVEAVLRS